MPCLQLQWNDKEQVLRSIWLQTGVHFTEWSQDCAFARRKTDCLRSAWTRVSHASSTCAELKAFSVQLDGFGIVSILSGFHRKVAAGNSKPKTLARMHVESPFEACEIDLVAASK